MRTAKFYIVWIAGIFGLVFRFTINSSDYFTQSAEAISFDIFNCRRKRPEENCKILFKIRVYRLYKQTPRLYSKVYWDLNINGKLHTTRDFQLVDEQISRFRGKDYG